MSGHGKRDRSLYRSIATIETKYGGPTVTLYIDRFGGNGVIPPGLPDGLRRKILAGNPLATYARLQEDA